MTSLILLVLGAIGLTTGQLTVNLPHGHDLKVLVDQGFARLDHNPKDGSVTENEYNYIVTYDDANNDSCVTLTEYTTSHQTTPLEISEKMFLHFDHDRDNCLDVADMAAEFHIIDTSGDGMVSLHEWDHYYTHLLGKLFGHGGGHGHQG